MAVIPAKTFKLKTRTNMQLSPQTKVGFAQQPPAAANQSQQAPQPAQAPQPPPQAQPPPVQENLTGKPVFVPYQHIPPGQQAKAMGQPQQQAVKTQHAPIQGKLIQRAAPVAQPPPPPQQFAPPPPPTAAPIQYSPPPSQQPLRPMHAQQQYLESRPQADESISSQEYQEHHERSPFTPPVPKGHTINPEASIKEISLNPVSSPFAQKPAVPQKAAGIYAFGDSSKVSEDIQKILENEAENYKDQVQSYVDVCEILSQPGWQVADIVDYIHMLVRSVNLDVISIVITDPSQKDRFLPVASRGFKNSPSAQVLSCWLPAVSEESTIIWDQLLEVALDKKNQLAKWISREGLNFVGYVPLHDNNKIYGFLFVAAANEGKSPSALASSLLELCGGRIGLVLESRRSASSLPEKAVQTAKLVKEHLAMLSSYLEILKISGKINPGEVANVADKCLVAVSESKKLIDRFADDVIASSPNEKNG